ncbi:MAG: hypothetical protein FJY19_01225 [Bacteroidetes bacterium]|nr:hypothetical protein [Bacteroidota bacterium]
MIPVFREYLALTHQLPLDGLGYIRVRNIPAQLDIAARVIASPRQEFYFESTNQVEAQDFLNWLSSRDNLPVSMVHQQYLTVLSHLNSHQSQNECLLWKGIGNWKLDTNRSLQFTATNECFTAPMTVIAEKVIRENVAHSVQVGESSIDSITMAKNLQQQKGKFMLKGGWLLLLFIVVGVVSTWILLSQQLTPAMFSNPAKVTPGQATPTYRSW